MSERCSRTNTASGVWHVALVAVAIIVPLFLTSCSKKKRQSVEQKTAQKSEDNFLDPTAKPDERKYLLAAKPFFLALADRKYLSLLRRTPTLSKTRRMSSTTSARINSPT